MAEELKTKALSIFSGLSSRYDKFLDIFTFYQDRKWKRNIVFLSSLNGKRVLEVACGTCRLGQYLKGAALLVGADISLEMIKHSGRRKKLYDLIVVADAEYLPFREGTFDAVLSCYLPKYVKAGRMIDSFLSCIVEDGEILTYDFVWPAGIFSVPYMFYVYFIFRIISAVARAVGSRTEMTFRLLPYIIRKSRWVDEMRFEANLRGMAFFESKLTFGTVSLVRAKMNL